MEDKAQLLPAPGTQWLDSILLTLLQNATSLSLSLFFFMS